LILCAKICGDSHYKMQKPVRVVTQVEYDAWVAKLTPYLNNDLRKVYKLPVIAEPTATPAATAASDTAAKDTTAKTNQSFKKIIILESPYYVNYITTRYTPPR
jgi:cytochrome c oxidase subunit 2